MRFVKEEVAGYTYLAVRQFRAGHVFYYSTTSEMILSLLLVEVSSDFTLSRTEGRTVPQTSRKLPVVLTMSNFVFLRYQISEQFLKISETSVRLVIWSLLKGML